MLTPPPSVRIFAARAATDLRKSFDTLAALATDVLEENPYWGTSPASSTAARTG